MCGDETRELAGRGVGAVDDEGHEEECEGQIFGVEVQDEEVDLTGGVVLCESICVCECECGEESVAVEEKARNCLCVQSASILKHKIQTSIISSLARE